MCFFFFKQKTAYEIGLGIPAEPLFRSATTNQNVKKRPACSELRWAYCKDRKSGSAGMPRPISYAVFCLKKKKKKQNTPTARKKKILRRTITECMAPHPMRHKGQEGVR